MGDLQGIFHTIAALYQHGVDFTGFLPDTPTTFIELLLRTLATA